MYLLSKGREEGEAKDSIILVVRDLILIDIKMRMALLMRYLIPALGFCLLSIFLLFAPIISTIGALYASPLAIFLPSLSADSVGSVLSGYYREFTEGYTTLAEEHTGYDDGRIVYVNSSGGEVISENYYDILATYLVLCGYEDPPTDMTDRMQRKLKDVFDDMCFFTTRLSLDPISPTRPGETPQIKRTLIVEVTLLTAGQMSETYRFNEDQTNMLSYLMREESLASMDGAGVGSRRGLSAQERSQILSGIHNPGVRRVCEYALSRVGYPYSQERRDSGLAYDCSSLMYYSYLEGGINLSHGGSTSAAEIGRGLEESGRGISLEDLSPGDLIFYSYSRNGRYRNISHVAIYVGNGKLVEAKNEAEGVVLSPLHVNRVVLVARP